MSFVDIKIIDKRETGGVSTNMEVTSLRKLLERIVGKLVASEIVTDASTSIIALVRKMKGTVLYIIFVAAVRCEVVHPKTFFAPPPSPFYELLAPNKIFYTFSKKQFANWPTALKKKTWHQKY